MFLFLFFSKGVSSDAHAAQNEDRAVWGDDDEALGRVQCCSDADATCSRTDDNNVCLGFENDAYKLFTYNEAVASCESQNRRLCTQEETGEIGGRCCNKGCNGDYPLAWTSDMMPPPPPSTSAASPTPPEAPGYIANPNPDLPWGLAPAARDEGKRFWLVDGCHSIGGDEGATHAPASYAVGYTQCCSGDPDPNKKTCKRKHAGVCFSYDDEFPSSGKASTHYEATQKCTDAGMRLCTKEELLSDEAAGCCGTGCGLNSGMAWSSTENVGADRVEVPLSPDDDPATWTETVLKAPYGSTFVFAPGVYRQFSVEPRTGDTFVGGGNQETDVVLTGANIVARDEYKPRSTGIYVAAGRLESEPPRRHGDRCNNDAPRCNYESDLFIDGEPLQHVATEADVVLGCNCWHFNYEAKRFVFESADDPHEHTLELSVAEFAIGQGCCQASGVEAQYITVQKLTTQMYANSAQFGAIGHQMPGRGWLVEGVLSTLNHGVGAKVREEGLLLNTRMIKNGMQAASSTAGGKPAGPCVIDGNELAWSTYSHRTPEKVWPGYNAGWGCGGIKFSSNDGAILRNNYVHHNGGRGLWADVSVINAVYVNNVCVNNSADGIAHEISFDAEIHGNILCTNGKSNNGWFWGNGICVQNSGGYRTDQSFSSGTVPMDSRHSGEIFVHNNIVVVGEVGNAISVMFQERGHDHTQQGFGQYTPVNIRIQNNDIIFTDEAHGRGGFAVSGNGFAGSGPVTLQDTYDTAKFVDNEYYYNGVDKRFGFGGNTKMTKELWMETGNDVDGNFSTADGVNIPAECYADTSPLLTTPADYTVFDYPLPVDAVDDGITTSTGKTTTTEAPVTEAPVNYEYWLSDGCWSEGAAVPGKFSVGDEAVGHVQCCSDPGATDKEPCIREFYSFITYEKECLSKDGPVTYNAAVKACKQQRGADRLCTKEELETGTSSGCCSLGCGVDDVLVWTSNKQVASDTPPPPSPPSPRVIDDASADDTLALPPTPAPDAPGEDAGGLGELGEPAGDLGELGEPAADLSPSTGGGLSTPALAGIIAGGAVLLGAGIWLVVRRDGDGGGNDSSIAETGGGGGAVVQNPTEPSSGMGFGF